MTHHNIFAYTELTNTYPGYISINKTGIDEVSVTVRASGASVASTIVLTQDQFRDFIIDMVEKGYANPI